MGMTDKLLVLYAEIGTLNRERFFNSVSLTVSGAEELA